MAEFIEPEIPVDTGYIDDKEDSIGMFDEPKIVEDVEHGPVVVNVDTEKRVPETEVTKEEKNAGGEGETEEDEIEEEENGPVPENLLMQLFQNLDVNGNGIIDFNDLELLMADLNYEGLLKGLNFKDNDDIKMEEISEMLKDLHAEELKKLLEHPKLKFVESAYEQTNYGDIFALYRIFDELNIDRRNLLTDDHKYLKRDASGISIEHLGSILENLDRKSLLKLLSLSHVEQESVIFTWKTFFGIIKLADVVFYFMCAVVCADAVSNTNVENVSCEGRDSLMASIFEAYLVIKGINYSFELCLVSCSYLFRNPRDIQTRYIISFLPFLSWAFSIVFRHACVFVGFVEVNTAGSECIDLVEQESTSLYVFFWWAMVYETISLCIFAVMWTALPFMTCYMLMIAVNGRSEKLEGEDEALTEFMKEQFHSHVRSGDHFFEIFVNMTGLQYIVKKNDLARILVRSNPEQELSDKDVMLWTEQDVYKWVKSIDMEKYAQKFVDNRISGNLLLTHVDPQLLYKGFQIRKEDVEFIWKKLNELRKPTTVGSWSVNEVVDWLCRIKMVQYVDDFRSRNITGADILAVSDSVQDALEQIPDLHRVQLMGEMKVLRNEGAPMTVGRHPLNVWGKPLAISDRRANLDETGRKNSTGYTDIEALTPENTTTLNLDEDEADV